MPEDQLTRADLAGMSPEQIVAAKQQGRCEDLLSGTADRPTEDRGTAPATNPEKKES